MPIDVELIQAVADIEAAEAETAPLPDIEFEWRGLPLVIPPAHKWIFRFLLAQRRDDVVGMTLAILGDEQVDAVIDAGYSDLADIDALLTACAEAGNAGEA